MVPRHDPLPRKSGAARGAKAARIAEPKWPIPPRTGKKPDPKRRTKDDGGETCPVEPNRPSNLSGGAAAALEFDD